MFWKSITSVFSVSKFQFLQQVTTIYINHSRPIIPDGIHLLFWKRFERSQTYSYMLSAKQGSIWYHFYNVFGMTQSGTEPSTCAL